MNNVDYGQLKKRRKHADEVETQYQYRLTSAWLSYLNVKRDKLDATCFIITLFSAQHVSDVNTSILRHVRLIR